MALKPFVASSPSCPARSKTVPIPPAGAKLPKPSLIPKTIPWCAALVWFLASSRNAAPKSTARALQTFWRGFTSGEPALVVFSNFRFLGLPDGSLQTLKDSDASGQPVIDTYTTIGEVMGVCDVGQTLSLFNKPPRVKRGRLLTWDEANDSSLVFIGGPLAGTPPRDVQMLRHFRFLKRSPDTSGAIANLHPAPGEQAL